MKLSIIVPCKNEEGNVIDIYNKVNEVLKKVKYEIIFIDDGSTDKTMEKLREVYTKDMLHVKVLSFSRNFKKESAMYAGLKHATGEYTCIIDGDCQQNPSYLMEMMHYLDENPTFDEVAMIVNKRTKSGFMRFCTKVFYKMIDSLSDVHFENSASDFRMFRTNVKEAILSLSEKVRFSKGMFSWVGFSVKYLPYEVEQRASGESKFNFKASLTYAIDGILSFSTKPLKLALVLGLLLLFTSFIYLVVYLVQILGFQQYFSAIHFIVILMLFLFGCQFIFMGILGEYLAKTYTEVKNRPIYVIKEKLGFPDETIL